jgi:hypothetical protein
LLEKEPRGLGRALSGGDVVHTVKTWRWYFWHYCYMSGICATVEGVVSVIWYYSDTPCHIWSCGWRGYDA